MDDPKELLARAATVFDRLQPAYEGRRPAMQDTEGRVSPRYHWYLSVMEFLRQTHLLAASIADELHGSGQSSRPIQVRAISGRARFRIAQAFGSPASWSSQGNLHGPGRAGIRQGTDG